MKRRSLLIALALSPAMALADSFSSRGAGDKRRERELHQQFRDNKSAMQKGELEEKKEPEKDKTDAGDSDKSTD